MKAVAFTLSVAVALALAACSSTPNQGSSSGGTSNQSTTSQIGQYSKEATLTTKVKSALAADVGLKTLTGINVDSEGTVVTLHGKVDTDTNKRRAEQVARAVEGVSTVKNELTVEAK
jgi:hyperosmotically inducible protein